MRFSEDRIDVETRVCGSQLEIFLAKKLIFYIFSHKTPNNPLDGGAIIMKHPVYINIHMHFISFYWMIDYMFKSITIAVIQVTHISVGTRARNIFYLYYKICKSHLVSSFYDFSYYLSNHLVSSFYNFVLKICKNIGTIFAFRHCSSLVSSFYLHLCPTSCHRVLAVVVIRTYM